jgi:hypothetical protein
MLLPATVDIPECDIRAFYTPLIVAAMILCGMLSTYSVEQARSAARNAPSDPIPLLAKLDESKAFIRTSLGSVLLQQSSSRSSFFFSRSALFACIPQFDAWGMVYRRLSVGIVSTQQKHANARWFLARQSLNQMCAVITLQPMAISSMTKVVISQADRLALVPSYPRASDYATCSERL